MNIKRVVFFNAAARGDIFIGRGFVKDVIFLMLLVGVIILLKI